MGMLFPQDFQLYYLKWIFFFIYQMTLSLFIFFKILMPLFSILS